MTHLYLVSESGNSYNNTNENWLIWWTIGTSAEIIQLRLSLLYRIGVLYTLVNMLGQT